MSPSHARAPEAPVFLVAAERSGTTLLRLMLDSHPQISWPAEFDYALDWPPAGPNAWPSREAFWHRLRESRQALAAQVEIDESLAFPALVRSLLEQLRRRSSKPVFGVTVHRGYERLLRLWPEARFVHLLRDGRAVSHSHVEMGWTGNAWAAARTWREAEQAWQALARAIPEVRRLELRFEELVRDPLRELSRVCAFLGVAPEPRMLSYPERSTYEAPRVDRVDAWREKLSRRDWALL
jgi:LPS sulfotransferase NodH